MSAAAWTAVPPESLRQYALLADGERGALVGPRGDVAFLCAPQWHDDAIFSALLGGRGEYVVRPADPRFVWGGSYEPGTLIWHSRWVVGEDVVECREALAHPAQRDRLVLLRRIEAVRGAAHVRVSLDLRPGFGADRIPLRHEGDGRWTGTGAGLTVRWSGAPTAAVVADGRDGIVLDLQLPAGSVHDLVLEVGRSGPGDTVEPDAAWRATERSWTTAVAVRRDPLAARDVRHSIAVLHGLTSRAGGMVAAATTSLPERAEQGRDYDYRFAWIRDQCFAGHAAAAAGDLGLLRSSVDFVTGRLLADGDQLVPAYTVDGDPVPRTRSLDLPGYPGAPDAKAGNRVHDQFQLDAFGEALVLIAGADRLDQLDGAGWKAAEIAADAIANRRARPDAGIWEVAPRRWAHSRLTCAAGLRAVAERRPDRAPDWLALAERLVTDAERDCGHPDGRWQRAPDDTGVDGALLLPPLRDPRLAAHPRTIPTRQAIERDLAEDGYVYRFRQQPGPLHEAEGAFLLCGMAMAMASHRQGDVVGAARWFERNRAAVGPPGLFTEEFDVEQRQLRGNLPQAFVHALLIEAAHVLATPPTPDAGGSA